LKVYRTAYNRLPDDVEAAHERLENDPGHIETIRSALRIIKDHEANDYLGLFLLHRHFKCIPGSLFIERRYTPRKGHARVLVTKGEPAGKGGKRIAPHRFAMASDGSRLRRTRICRSFHTRSDVRSRRYGPSAITPLAAAMVNA
jgi:hypothetical protein